MGAIGHVLLQVADQVTQLGGHGVEGSRQCADFVLALHFYAQFYVATGYLGSRFGQLGQWGGNGAGDVQGDERSDCDGDYRDASYGPQGQVRILKCFCLVLLGQQCNL